MVKGIYRNRTKRHMKVSRKRRKMGRGRRHMKGGSGNDVVTKNNYPCQRLVTVQVNQSYIPGNMILLASCKVDISPPPGTQLKANRKLSEGDTVNYLDPQSNQRCALILSKMTGDELRSLRDEIAERLR